jgi:hypothetical protein
MGHIVPQAKAKPLGFVFFSDFKNFPALSKASNLYWLGNDKDSKTSNP